MCWGLLSYIKVYLQPPPFMIEKMDKGLYLRGVMSKPELGLGFVGIFQVCPELGLVGFGTG